MDFDGLRRRAGARRAVGRRPSSDWAAVGAPLGASEVLGNSEYFNVTPPSVQGLWAEILRNTPEKNEEALIYHVTVFTKNFKDFKARPTGRKSKGVNSQRPPPFRIAP